MVRILCRIRYGRSTVDSPLRTFYAHLLRSSFLSAPDTALTEKERRKSTPAQAIATRPLLTLPRRNGSRRASTLYIGLYRNHPVLLHALSGIGSILHISRQLTTGCGYIVAPGTAHGRYQTGSL